MTPAPYVFLLKNAVGPEFLAYVNDIINLNINKFEANVKGKNRKFYKMDQVIPEGDRVLYEMKERLAAHYELGQYIVPPTLKDFLSYITDGGAIHPHTDPNLPGLRHVRINVLIRQTAGCIPLMEGIPLAVDVGDAWLNLASQCVHATTPAEGPGYRSALSFGYQILPHRGDELYEQHLKWKANLQTNARSRSPQHA